MQKTIFFLLIFWIGCTLPEKKKENQVSQKTDTTVFQSSDINTASADPFNSISLPVAKKLKSPDGIYQAVLPLKNKLEQTVEFNSDLTYHLQEKYFNGERDSVITTDGIWTPSDGYIWLYKDQIARGRYKWKGDILQYYSPVLKRNFSMHHLQEASQNAKWKNKTKAGVILFAVGNEPFWNVEIKKDSLSLLLAQQDQPLKIKIDSSFSTNDSTGYFGKKDSAQIRVTIFPHFCSDGMSDFVYRTKVKVKYNHQTYNGCGITYK